MSLALAGSLERAQALLRASGMARAWQTPFCWRVMELAGGQSSRPALMGFLACWQRWRKRTCQGDPAAARLHYVLIVPPPAAPPSMADPLDLQGLAQQFAGRASYARLALALTEALPRSLKPVLTQGPAVTAAAGHAGFHLPEFHRLAFDSGRVVLTVGIGSTRAMLREHAFVADAVLVSGGTDREPWSDWDRWTVKALAPLCRPGTTLTVEPLAGTSAALAPTSALTRLLQRGGFQREVETGGTKATRDFKAVWHGHFAPAWQPRTSRLAATAGIAAPLATPATPGQCVVIGAGLAGASVAAALAGRGWRVMVLDAAPAPAAGASGVPVGLLCPHVSRDDSPRSRLLRTGVHLCLQTLRTTLNTRLRQGRDWAATGAMERWLDDTVSPPPAFASRTGPLGGHPALWHDDAAWIKPYALVQAWLDSPGVTFAGGRTVASIHRDAGGWQLKDAQGTRLAQADMVVVAAAGASAALASTALPDGPGLRPLQAIHGQVSFDTQDGPDTSVLPPYPINGHGHLITHVPQPDGKAWYTGSTYETCEAGPAGEFAVAAATDAQIGDAHAANAERLNRLMQGFPDAAMAVAARFESGMRHWRGTRYTPTDRLPVCGPLDQGESGAAPSLWINCGLGSRGLSWAALCAELVAAQICGEPLPLPLGLARLLGSHRLAVRQTAHNPGLSVKKGL